MIAVTGGKGGCGKTTTALGVAAALARTGTTPLVVDADRDMPNCHTVAEVDRTPTFDALATAPVGRVAQESGRLPGVFVLPAGDDDPAAHAHAIRDHAGPILLDCAGGVTPRAVAPLRIADAAVAVSTPTRRSLTDAVKSIAVARTLDAAVLGCVVTRVDDARDERRARTLLSAPVRATVPETDAPLDDPVSRASYDRLATGPIERNI